ncbi:MAG: YtxH domain-containing protein [Archangium sp.]|nr:YtxH domain-containing protein [Archangium sp.]
MRDLKKRLLELEKDDLLEAVGLESRRSTAERMVPALALFGAGVLVGVGLGLLLAPKAGRELRSDVRQRLGRGAPGGAGKETAAPSGTRAV